MYTFSWGMLHIFHVFRLSSPLIGSTEQSCLYNLTAIQAVHSNLKDGDSMFL
jgi:hypothetical protein